MGPGGVAGAGRGGHRTARRRHPTPTPHAAGRPALVVRAAVGAVVVAIAATLAGCGGAAPNATATSTTSTTAHGSASASGRHVTVLPIPNFALPPAAAGCGGAVHMPDGATAIPVTVSRVAGQVAILLNVCIDGEGPFPFILDTGAAESVVVSQLAARLHLPAAGPSQEFGGVGCTASARPRRVDSWSAAGLPLLGQVVSGATIPGMGGRGQPVGLLGSDVWERFGAIRIDFSAGSVTVPGAEGPPPTAVRSIQGPTAVPTPPSLMTGTPTGVVPVKVISGEGSAEVIAQVSVGTHRPVPFAVDTGSSQSVVDQTTARGLDLTPTNVAERQTTVCSTITVPLRHVSSWAVGDVPLQPGPLATADLGPVQLAGFEGLLGSDQLIHFGSVVFDFDGGRLVLGAG